MLLLPGTLAERLWTAVLVTLTMVFMMRLNLIFTELNPFIILPFQCYIGPLSMC